MSGGVSEWDIHGPSEYAWTPDEVAQVVRAAQAFHAALPNATGKLHHTVTLHGVGVLPASVPVDWPQPGDPVIQLAPCPICGRKDWPEGGQHAARNIHMRTHENTADRRAAGRGEQPQPGDTTTHAYIPEHLEGAEVAQWLVDHPDARLIKP
jgi:hypothetical protein